MKMLSDEALAGWSKKVIATQQVGRLNCYSFDSQDIREGIDLEYDHPLTRPRTFALLLGETFFIPCNYFDMCEVVGRTVYSMEVTYREREGLKPVRLLSAKSASLNSLYVHVDSSIPLPQGATYKHRFYAGVRSDHIVASSRHEALVCLEKSGQEAFVFCMDGSVKCIAREGSKIVLVPMSVDEQADARIELAKTLLDEAQGLEHDRKVAKVDFAVFELVGIMKVGGKYSNAIFEQVFKLLIAAAEDGDIRTLVKEHILKALDDRPAERHAFSEMCLAVYAKKMSGKGAFGDFIEGQSEEISPEERRQRDLARVQREAKRKENRERRHAEQPAKGGK